LGKSIKTLQDEIAHIIDVPYSYSGDDRLDALPDIFYLSALPAAGRRQAGRIQVGGVRGRKTSSIPSLSASFTTAAALWLL